MASKNVKIICNELDELEPASRIKILEHLIKSLKFDLNKSAMAKTRRISELKGVGAKIWKKLDVEDYLKKERSAWKS